MATVSKQATLTEEKNFFNQVINNALKQAKGIPATFSMVVDNFDFNKRSKDPILNRRVQFDGFFDVPQSTGDFSPTITNKVARDIIALRVPKGQKEDVVRSAEAMAILPALGFDPVAGLRGGKYRAADTLVGLRRFYPESYKEYTDPNSKIGKQLPIEILIEVEERTPTQTKLRERGTKAVASAKKRLQEFKKETVDKVLSVFKRKK